MELISRIDQSRAVVEVEPNTSYGIMASSGLDSTVLLYFVLKAFKDKGLEPNLQVFTIPKRDWHEDNLIAIMDYMNKAFDIKLKPFIRVGSADDPHQLQTANAAYEIKAKYPINKIFFGTNQIPPDVKLPGLEPDRVKEPPHPNILIPFLKLYKDSILDFALQFNLQELLDLTHTCTRREKGRCNECWQCLERKWAFDKLKVKDTGVN